MCQSPNSSVVVRTIELNYEKVRRAGALRWLAVNVVLLSVLVYDLWQWCGGCAPGLLWVEAAAAAVLVANCAWHVARLVPRRRAPHPLSPVQARLLGLNEEDLDSSFRMVSPKRGAGGGAADVREEPGSLSPPRVWGGGGGSSRVGGDSPGTPPSPPSPSRAEPDEFIADGRALAAYIRLQEARAGPSSAGVGVGVCMGSAGGVALPSPPRAHQLAVLPERGGGKETTEEEVPGGGGGGGGGGGAPLWRRLDLDPQRLTEYNLNLRLWLHVTVVGRVARELAAAEAAGVALAALGGGGGAGGGRHDALLPFLQPFADRQYVAGRVQELAVGGCLSAYRWCGGGRGWAVGGGRPTDAELLLHLLATYIDMLAPGSGSGSGAGGGGAFSARHLSRAPAQPPRGPQALALHRAAPPHPPHYLLVLCGETLEVGAGRNNLLHALLLLIAGAARGAPPALCRLHLGAGGLNVLWVLGR